MSADHASPWRQWLKTARNPPQYLTASLIVTLGGLLNGSVSPLSHCRSTLSD